MADTPTGTIEVVATIADPMPTGVTVSHSGRMFVCFPRWGDSVTATVVELRNGECSPYPDQRWNSPSSDDDPNAFISVQSVVVDPMDRLWIVDTGAPLFQSVTTGGPKLVRVDLSSDTVTHTIILPPDVALPTTYLNDVRFDLRRGDAGMAFLTDSTDKGPNGIIVVDLASGESWRRLHDHPSTKAEARENFTPIVEGCPFREQPDGGPPKQAGLGSDGIALAADGSRLYYSPLISRRLYSVSVDALVDRSLDDAAVGRTVRDEGDKGSGADGLETDDAGRIYITAYEHNAILCRQPDGEYFTIAHDPRLSWPDTLCVANDGYLYATASQLHLQSRYQQGVDRRQKPYHVFRIPIDAGPVLLA